MRTALAITLISCLWSASASGAPDSPRLASFSAVALDIDADQVLVEKRSEVVLPIASLTKVMTAMVVLDSGASLTEWLTIQNWPSTLAKNAYSRIRIDSQARRKDLLRIALMSSENRASFNLAMHHPGGYKAFIAAMNAKAKALGMQDTQFVDPTGLYVANQSTTQDLARMLAAAYDYDVIRDYSTTRQFTVNFRGPKYRLGYGNTNPLNASSRWDVELSKTGYLTEAGRCLVMVAKMDGKNVAVALLNSFGKRSPLGDAGRIRRWLETGARGTIAKAAVDYEKRLAQSFGLE